MATWPSGKARLCKSLIVGSIPTVASRQQTGEYLTHTLVVGF